MQQGLLILSAAINSGATSVGNNNAYSKTPNTPYETSDKVQPILLREVTEKYEMLLIAILEGMYQKMKRHL